MRKSSESSRFPQSACLFKFCLRALEVRTGGKVHDQALGNILSYNPSDTSHWKRGKKAVRNIFALEKLAYTLDAAPELIQDVADGVIDLDDAWFEFEEAAELRRVNAAMTTSLRIDLNRRLNRIEAVANDILGKARIATIPVFLPELLELFPSIGVQAGEVSDKIARSSRGKPGMFLIRHRKGEMNPHTRAAIVRELARVVLFAEREQLGIGPRQEILEPIEIIAFSNALLVPKAALQSETQKQLLRADLVRSLAEAFWVPKAIIRTRLKEVVIENMSDSALSAEPVTVRNIGGAAKIGGFNPMPPMAEMDDYLAEDASGPVIEN
jgi:hypothetical protein